MFRECRQLARSGNSCASVYELIEMPSFHSDKSKKHYTFNPGKKGNLSEQPLILLNYMVPLNQRVHSSRLCAPTIEI
jgi:hypothetical protein